MEGRATLIKAVEKKFKVVDRPGPNVLKIQVALTQLVPVNPVVNAVTASVALLPLDLGSAAIEVRFVDSVTGRVIAEAKDMKKGRPLRTAPGLEPLEPRAGTRFPTGPRSSCRAGWI